MGYNIQTEKVATSRLGEIDFNNLKFGRAFSDHMFVADYENGKWENLRIVPFQNINISPANMTIHYGQTIFEGLKATRDDKGNALLFRPEMNARRLNFSAKRMSMPELPEELFLQGLEELVKLDANWIPKHKGHSLYIRPFMFATDEYVGVKSSDSYKFFIITTPVGAYYSEPVSLLASEKYVRAAHGGVGEAKTAGNYAATLLPVQEANAAGYDQILWLDAKDFKYIQECGTMNLFFHIGDKIVTPKTDGAILHGITRNSVIKLLTDKGITVEERDVSIDEIVEADKKGLLKDVFGTGTAAVITHVSDITYRDYKVTLPAVAERALSLEIKEDISSLRAGLTEDTNNWLTTVPLENINA